ncbi:MAG: hypothetical protein KF811_09570 [Dokdonella sp.]|nr:hypothetical protein [Dokdonella sp.]MCB1570139.1 hypothetical protein [Xanthomonadales bacterium]MCB1573161.1 hypothetical protein [Xanthomonadales bacterium]MCB1576072.1 hypothetical protein [Xanthomonadales bacterium]
MRRALAAIVTLLAGCAVAPVEHRADWMFNDARFAAPAEPIRSDNVFALDSAMRRYVATSIAPGVHSKGAKQALFDALYGQGQLKLDYDTELTRTAAQAFSARAGNCLSLAILTSALAKELELTVRYQMVYRGESWSRSDDTIYFDEHVNVTLIGEQPTGSRIRRGTSEMTIDFLSQRDLRNLHFRVIAENTIVSMFMNNRAAETMAASDLDGAYWWARAAIEADPHYLPAKNTLGVIYHRHHDLQSAERLFRHILDIEPDNFIAMSNLVQSLRELGKTSEADRFERRMAEIKPYPPFYYFDLGMEAMEKRNFAAARSMFRREIQRQAYYDKLHYWLALASYELGDVRDARKHLGIAIETSTTRKDRESYVAELARLNSGRLH